jgi:hypothetical protein
MIPMSIRFCLGQRRSDPAMHRSSIIQSTAQFPKFHSGLLVRDSILINWVYRHKSSNLGMHRSNDMEALLQKNTNIPKDKN